MVTGYEDGRLLLRQRNRFFAGDTLDALIPSQPPMLLTAEDLRDGEGTLIEATPHPDMELSIAFDRPLPVGSLLRKERTEDITTA